MGKTTTSFRQFAKERKLEKEKATETKSILPPSMIQEEMPNTARQAEAELMDVTEYGRQQEDYKRKRVSAYERHPDKPATLFYAEEKETVVCDDGGFEGVKPRQKNKRGGLTAEQLETLIECAAICKTCCFNPSRNIYVREVPYTEQAARNYATLNNRLRSMETQMANVLSAVATLQTETSPVVNDKGTKPKCRPKRNPFLTAILGFWRWLRNFAVFILLLMTIISVFIVCMVSLENHHLREKMRVQETVDIINANLMDS